MYLLGHVGLSVLAFSLFERKSDDPDLRKRLMVGIGSMLPDFLDKPIGAIFFETGRWFGHSIIFQFSVFVVLYGIWKTKEPYADFLQDSKLLYLGASLHLVGDQPSLGYEVPLWPLFGPFQPGTKEAFLMGYQDPLTILLEIVGLISLVYLSYVEDWGKKANLVIVGVTVTYLILFLLVYSLLVGTTG